MQTSTHDSAYMSTLQWEKAPRVWAEVLETIFEGIYMTEYWEPFHKNVSTESPYRSDTETSNYIPVQVNSGHKHKASTSNQYEQPNQQDKSI